jgi:hypothetical protein
MPAILVEDLAAVSGARAPLASGPAEFSFPGGERRRTSERKGRKGLAKNAKKKTSKGFPYPASL